MIIKAASLEALRVGLRSTFNDAYKSMHAETFYRDVATVVPSSAKAEVYGWLKRAPRLREWIGERVVRDIAEAGYTIPNRKFESTIGVLRTDLEDDTLGTYTPLVQYMAHEAAVHPDRLLAELFAAGTTTAAYDGQNYFDTDHPVAENHDGTGVVATVSNYVAGTDTPWFLLDCSKPLRPFIFQERSRPEFDSLDNPNTTDSVFMRDEFLYGTRYRCNAGFGFWQCAYRSEETLNLDTFRAARAAMRGVRADGGEPLGIRPTHLVVPSTLQSAAEDTIEVMLKGGGNTNPVYRTVKVLVVDWLG